MPGRGQIIKFFAPTNVLNRYSALGIGCRSMYSAKLTVILKSPYNLIVPSGFGMSTVAQSPYFTLSIAPIFSKRFSTYSIAGCKAYEANLVL